jgi:DNA-binding Lrp family transcriptional regulator
MARPRGHRLDQIDLKLIHELLNNPDIPLEILAPRVGLTYSPCRKRLLHLLNRGYLLRNVRVSEERMRWQSLHMVTVKLPDNSEGQMRQFIDRMQTIVYVIECDAVSGYWDFLLRVATPNIKEFNEVRAQMIEGFFGAKTETTEIVRTVRQYYVPPEALFDSDADN